MADGKLQLVLVTPEKTLLNEPADSLKFPLFDGLIGVYPSRAPMVGRLGFGELVIQSSTGEKSYFIDGGFAQVKGHVISILTNDATTLDGIDTAALKTELAELTEKSTTNDADQEAKNNRINRIQKMLKLAH
ncbi:MAG: F0F1 ATP synthase subunit epsilon [Planctomycetaceae bacterium]|jgi:F-type H+-transporting ATPase subunit epsilon|nr:F0F1 ATP synthase subunit epsilon [Planctomycetaceae bacterium]MDG2388441.1 F0F1 ATP synthase subunit epsilon [Planctomycetaceae bacterium]